FNRFYTRSIGLLGEGHLESTFTLTEVRVLYELAQREGVTATELVRDLGLDPGYLSRILLKFRKQGFLDTKRSTTDARQRHLLLTAKGRKTFAPLDRAAAGEVAAMLAPLSRNDRARLTDAMRAIQELLGSRPQSAAPYVLRPHEPGDIGWVIHRHG